MDDERMTPAGVVLFYYPNNAAPTIRTFPFISDVMNATIMCKNIFAEHLTCSWGPELQAVYNIISGNLLPVASSLHLSSSGRMSGIHPYYISFTTMNGSVKTVLLCGALFASLATANTAFGQWTRNAGTGETYVTNTGDKIGIGTTTPQSKVHIYSTENFPELKIQTTNGGGSPRLVFLHGTLGAGTEWRPGFIQSIGDAATYTGALEFYTNGTGSANRFGFVRAMTMINGDVGIGLGGSTVPLSKLHVADGAFLVSGTTGSTPTSGAGTRLMYVPASGGALRAGVVSGTQWDNATIGTSSFATGENVTASGPHALAAGFNTTASGFQAASLGINTVAQPQGALVIGRNNIVSGTTNSWELLEPVFVIGNGIATSSRANAFTVLKNGNTHIGGANPAGYMLYVSGNAYATGSWISSDARFKTNIATVDGALAKVMSLKGVTYDFKREEFKDRNFPEGKQLGFIAQDLEKIVPEVVNTDTDGYKAVAYQNLTALLTEAIKEQQGTISGLRSENAELKARLQAIESRLGITPAGGAGDLK